jgi:RNA polymerase sigma factor (sigma-70 family)
VTGIRGRDPLRDPEPLIRRVYAYVAYRIGDGPTAEDVTSDVFERALRYRESFDASKGEPIAWLIGIARRCISEAAASTVEPMAEPPTGAAPLDLEDEAVRRLTLSTAIGELHSRDRELIALRYGSDLTARQIGEVLGVRTNAVEVALHRALGRLRTALEEPQRGALPVAAGRSVRV